MTPRITLSPFHLVTLSLLTLAGCGGEHYPIAPISGTVTLDGQPLANARIGFEPRRVGDSINAGPGSYGKTNAAGHYELETLTGESGAVVTTHDVWIRTAVAPANRSGTGIPAVKEKLPARYNNATTLTFEVTPAGSAAANFDLLTSSE